MPVSYTTRFSLIMRGLMLEQKKMHSPARSRLWGWWIKQMLQFCFCSHSIAPCWHFSGTGGQVWTGASWPLWLPSGSSKASYWEGQGLQLHQAPCPVLLLPRLLDGCRQSSIWSEQGPTEINSSESTQEVRAKDGIGPCWEQAKGS